ncbi:hypothetical protein RDWZM_005760, partial [Blomia tropicalis]
MTNLVYAFPSFHWHWVRSFTTILYERTIGEAEGKLHYGHIHRHPRNIPVMPKLCHANEFVPTVFHCCCRCIQSTTGHDPFAKNQNQTKQ